MKNKIILSSAGEREFKHLYSNPLHRAFYNKTEDEKHFESVKKAGLIITQVIPEGSDNLLVELTEEGIEFCKEKFGPVPPPLNFF